MLWLDWPWPADSCAYLLFEPTPAPDAELAPGIFADSLCAALKVDPAPS